eukprot:jgi/Botrbrau1/2181/Bobra.101_2s0017.1
MALPELIASSILTTEFLDDFDQRDDVPASTASSSARSASDRVDSTLKGKWRGAPQTIQRAAAKGSRGSCPSPKPKPPSASAAADTGPVNVKTLIQRHTARVTSSAAFAQPVCKNSGRMYSKSRTCTPYSSVHTSAPSSINAAATPTVDASGKAQTMVIRAVSKPMPRPGEDGSNEDGTAAPATSLSLDEQGGASEQHARQAVPRRDLVIHLTRPATTREEGPVELNRNHEARLILLERQQMETRKTLSLLSSQLSAWGERFRHFIDSAREGEWFRRRTAFQGDITATAPEVPIHLAQTSSLLDTEIEGFVPSSMHQELREMREQIQLLETRTLKQDIFSTENKVTYVGEPIVSVEEAGARICALEQDLLSMRHYNMRTGSAANYSTSCCGKAVPLGRDEQRLQDREAMLAAREVRVLDMQRKLADMEVSRQAAEERAAEAQRSLLGVLDRVALLEKQISMAGLSVPGTPKSGAATPKSKIGSWLLRAG